MSSVPVVVPVVPSEPRRRLTGGPQSEESALTQGAVGERERSPPRYIFADEEFSQVPGSQPAVERAETSRYEWDPVYPLKLNY